MSETFETYEQAWQRRRSLRGEVDFTMMYVGHDAFARDLQRLVASAESGTICGPEARATWKTFSDMLHLHHSMEDTALWPPLRTAVRSTKDGDLLDAMEAEHSGIDPSLRAIDEMFGTGDEDALTDRLHDLQRALRAHMQHEEDEALPLLERTLGAEGWSAFGAAAHKLGGMSAAATMLPWSLEGASPEASHIVLGLVPPPARMIYRRFWAPKYAKGVRLR